MNRQSISIGVAVAGLLLSCSFFGQAQNPSSAGFQDAVRQSDKAAKEFQEMMNAADHGIPHGILDSAQCVVIFPDVLKAAFIVGAGGGRGVASCRTARGWSAPAYYHIDAGSWGAQIGADSTDLVLLIMNHKGMNKLLEDHLKLAADATLAIGPWGREVGAATDVQAGAEILVYSRAKGAFAGIDLSGALIRRDKEDMNAVYGPAVSTRAVLEGTVRAPRSADMLPRTLLSYSPAKGVKGTTEQGLRNQPAH